MKKAISNILRPTLLNSALLMAILLVSPSVFAASVYCLTVTCPADKVVNCGTSWTFDTPTVALTNFSQCSDCPGYTITVLSTVTNGTCPQYNVTRTWGISTVCSINTSSCSQTVTVLNTNQAVFHGLTNLVFYTCMSTQVFYPTITASESCCGNLAVTCLPPSGSFFAPGTVSFVGCYATDCCGRNFYTDFAVQVILPNTIAAYCADKYVPFGDTNWTFDPPSVYDDCCPGNYTFVPQTPITNQASGPMIITEVWGVTDGCGQSTYCTETVYVTNTPDATYNISWHKVAGGGGSSGAGAFAVSGTAGQWDAGKMNGSNLNLNGGFWVVAEVGAFPPAVYSVVELGTLGGNGTDGDPFDPGSAAFSINSLGQIVGQAYDASNANVRAVFWTNSSSSPLDLGVLNGSFSQANWINDLGQIVGDSGDQLLDPVIWATSLSAPAALADFGVTAVPVQNNNSGQSVGYTYLDPDFLNIRATFWPNISSAAVDLGTLGGTNAEAWSINDSGQIVGSANPPGSTSLHAAFWTDVNSLPQDLGTFGHLQSRAFSINRLGQIVGVATDSSIYDTHAIFWPDANSAPVALATPGSDYSGVSCINTLGQIVGFVGRYSAAGPFRAVLWPNSNSPAIDLNTLIPANSGWVLEIADAINDSGEIVGIGTLNGHGRAFALKPLNPDFKLLITSAVRSGNDLQLSFASQASHTYNVLTTSDLVTGTWSTLLTGIPGNGGIVSVTIPNTFDQPRQFFRIQQAP